MFYLLIMAGGGDKSSADALEAVLTVATSIKQSTFAN